MMRKPLSPQISPTLIPPTSDRRELGNYNRIYCNVPLRQLYIAQVTVTMQLEGILKGAL